MSTITRLWNDDKLPVRDGLYLATGVSYGVRLKPELPGGLEILEEFDLSTIMEESPDAVMIPSMSGQRPLPGGDALWFGEGSWGSEGFFARITSGEELVWVVYLEHSNPFDRVELNGDLAAFHSTSEVYVTVDVRRPTTPVPIPRGR